ncbi:hypothetical protein LSTR_LSTR014522 [Laodelphax striatellus]|uniref:Uncharacterized protein n=1 Tax=Laodelphax striatellus TaxID=195883 RepID=A0A482X9X1_LAOST|nr:hypothetical protein LSTR_LSTR014522 [Laodelphax striatellus]
MTTTTIARTNFANDFWPEEEEDLWAKESSAYPFMEEVTRLEEAAKTPTGATLNEFLLAKIKPCALCCRYTPKPTVEIILLVSSFGMNEQLNIMTLASIRARARPAPYNRPNTPPQARIAPPPQEVNKFSVSATAGNAQISNTRANAIQPFLTAPISQSNVDDFRRVATSWVLPGQLMIRPMIKRDGIAKSLQLRARARPAPYNRPNNTPPARRIAPPPQDHCWQRSDDAKRMDLVIGKWLADYGFKVGDPSSLTSSYPSAQSALAAWRDLLMREDRSGWMNDGCVDTYAIPDPLYAHLNSLPMYAGRVRGAGG